jgi:hypothetical protein
MTFQLRLYQIENAAKGVEILRRLGIVYFSMQVRTGKSLTALEAARLYGARSVLFLTKKKAIASIEGDFEKLNPGYRLTVANDESLHKVVGDFDLLIYDEAHRLSGFPKPGVTARAIKERFSHLPIILLSGTPTPEGWSQIYHQFWVSQRSPFAEKTFYKWAHNYVDIKQRTFAHGTVNDYSAGIYDKIFPLVEPYMVSFTQEAAGFVVQLHEHFCPVPMAPICKTIADRLMTSGVAQGKTGIISADNAAALQQKIHQVHSGTCILDEEQDGSRQSVILSDAKAQFIAKTWPTEKLVIFYQFKAELIAIQKVLGDRITTDLEEFQSSDKSCAFQVVSGREGIDLSLGELIVFYNISHSAVSYYQARDRLTTSTRPESHIYWLISQHDGESGIEAKIYDVVQGKKKYTVAHFRKDFKGCLSQKFRATASKSMSPMAIGS